MGEYGKKLTEAHCEQIRNMLADEKSYAEIREFFQTTYKIKLWDSEIASIKRGERKSPKRIIKRGKIKPPEPRAEAQETGNEFAFHIHEAFNIHKKDFIKRVEEALAIL